MLVLNRKGSTDTCRLHFSICRNTVAGSPYCGELQIQIFHFSRLTASRGRLAKTSFCLVSVWGATIDDIDVRL